MKRLTVRGHVSTFTGYGQMLCELVAGLDKLGVYCAIRPATFGEPWGATVPLEVKSRIVSGLQPEAWEFLIHPPEAVPTTHKKTLYMTMWESTYLSQRGVDLLNKAEMVSVPCEWNKIGFANSGVKVPIEVVPLGINEEIFSYISPRPDRSKFIVGAAGRVSHGPNRKGIARSIEVFQKTFPGEQDVELRVKVHPDDATPDVRDHRIIIEKNHFTWAQMREWFSRLDVFLSMVRAEGFGLLQLQAMACGRPVLAASYAGLSQFLNATNGYCLPYKEVHNPDFGGGLWAEPDEKETIEVLRHCYEQRNDEAVFRKGEEAAETAKTFTWDKTVLKTYRLLASVGAFA